MPTPEADHRRKRCCSKGLRLLALVSPFPGAQPRSGLRRGVNPPDTPADKRIAVAADDPRLYDSFREGEFSYRVPLPNGRYRVVLKFAEPSAGAAGERVFDVDVGGATVLISDATITRPRDWARGCRHKRRRTR